MSRSCPRMIDWSRQAWCRRVVAVVLFGVCLLVAVPVTAAQVDATHVEIGDVVSKDVLVRTVPATGLRSALELVRSRPRTGCPDRSRGSEPSSGGG